MLGGGDRLSAAPTFQQLLASAEGLTYRSHRTLIGREALAREYGPKDISKIFHPNGSQDAYNLSPEHLEHPRDNYARWRLQVDGLVMRPASFSLTDSRA